MLSTKATISLVNRSMFYTCERGVQQPQDQNLFVHLNDGESILSLVKPFELTFSEYLGGNKGQCLIWAAYGLLYELDDDHGANIKKVASTSCST